MLHLMHPLGPSVTDWISAVAGAAGVLVAIGAVWLTLRQVRLTAKQMRLTATREQEDSEARTRPYVGLDVVPGIAGQPSFDLVIFNTGRTTARDVRIELVGDKFDAQSEGDKIGPALGRFFASSFDLAPGARRRLFWHHPPTPNADPPGALGVPVASEVRASYRWVPDNGREPRNYTESLRYDLTEYPYVVPVPTTGATSTRSADDTIKYLQNIVHAIHAVATHLGEARR